MELNRRNQELQAMKAVKEKQKELERAIREQIETERRLRDCEERFRRLADSAPIKIWTADSEMKCTYVNKVWLDFTGRTLDQEQGDGWIENVHPKDVGRCLKTYRSAVEKRASFKTDYRLRRRDGVYRWLTACASPYFTSDGEFSGFVGSATDITENKRMARGLTVMDRALASIGVGVVMTDPSRKGNPIVYSNPAFQRITGYAEKEVLGRNCRLLYGTEPDQPGWLELRKAVEARCEGRAVVRAYRKDGTPFWDEVVVSPVVDSEGNLTHYVCIHNDITEKKESQEQMLQAQRMEAIGILASGIAHDFNNILSALLGHTELIRLASSPDAPWSKYLEGLFAGIQRARYLVTQIMTFSCQESSDPIHVNLRLAVPAVVRLLRVSLAPTIEIVEHNLERDLWVYADPTKIHQVIMNLCTNAVQAMAGEQGRLEIRLAESQAQEDLDRGGGPPHTLSVCLVVADDGMGMNEETRSRIFDPFFTTKGVGKGTGLGLSVVHGIVKDLKGRIQVESKPGQGSTFRVYLPCVDAAPASNGTRSRAAQTVPGQGKRIMIVEDDMIVAGCQKIILDNLGYDVIAEIDPEAALERFKSSASSFDLVLLDHGMPKMSGDQLASRMRRIRPDIPMIVNSGYLDSRAIKAKYHGCMISMFIAKPVEYRRLAEAIQRVLNDAAARQGAVRKTS